MRFQRRALQSRGCGTRCRGIEPACDPESAPYRESTRHLQPEMPALPSELLAWGGSAPPPSVPVRSTFKTLFKQQQLVQKREEERAEAAALESKATKRLANMASIAASKSMRSMPGLAR